MLQSRATDANSMHLRRNGRFHYESPEGGRNRVGAVGRCRQSVNAPSFKRTVVLHVPNQKCPQKRRLRQIAKHRRFCLLLAVHRHSLLLLRRNDCSTKLLAYEADWPDGIYFPIYQSLGEPAAGAGAGSVPASALWFRTMRRRSAWPCCRAAGPLKDCRRPPQSAKS